MARLIDYEAHAPIFGDPIITIDLDSEERPERRPPGSILVGVDRHGRLPPVHDDFDLVLSAAARPPRPWVDVGKETIDDVLAVLQRKARSRPLAVSTLAQVLRLGARLPVADAMLTESLAYSMLLGGSEFRAWRTGHPAPGGGGDREERIRWTRDRGTIRIELANPTRYNEIDAQMRDALCEALAAVFDDPTASELHLCAQGRAFSIGGALEEFGTTLDLASAHAIRSLRSPALLLHRLEQRTTAFVHGPCIGSGIEIAAAAGRIVASCDSWFSLPEVSMGLIPGAGGTVTITSRVGRCRSLYWALTGRKLNAATALRWGLVDEVLSNSCLPTRDSDCEVRDL
jgi:enoyl-CoA hydratase/carnithine racemase